MSRKNLGILILATVAAATRLLAIGINDAPHDDVTVGVLVAESIVEGEGITMPFVHWREFGKDRFSGRLPPDP